MLIGVNLKQPRPINFFIKKTYAVFVLRGRSRFPSSPTKTKQVMEGETDVSRKKTAESMSSWRLI